MMTGDELPLPAGITYEMIIPFTMAWRSTSTALSWIRRAALVSTHLQNQGFLATPETILAAADALVDALNIDAVCPPVPVVDLVPPDKKCCVCGCADLTVSSHSSQGTLHGLSESRTVRIQTKECTRCSTGHHYSFFSTSTAMAILFVPDAKRIPLEVSQLS